MEVHDRDEEARRRLPDDRARRADRGACWRSGTSGGTRSRAPRRAPRIRAPRRGAVALRAWHPGPGRRSTSGGGSMGVWCSSRRQPSESCSTPTATMSCRVTASPFPITGSGSRRCHSWRHPHLRPLHLRHRPHPRRRPLARPRRSLRRHRPGEGLHACHTPAPTSGSGSSWLRRSKLSNPWGRNTISTISMSPKASSR